MPHVEISIPVKAPAAEAWAAVKRLEDYSEYMESVESVTMLAETDAGVRTSEWSVLLKGSVLEWVEEDVLDEENRIMSFSQTSGDLDEFTGYWRVDADGDNAVVVFFCDFEIGIPLLADMLNPVATKALRENAESMLAALERRITAAA